MGGGGGIMAAIFCMVLRGGPGTSPGSPIFAAPDMPCTEGGGVGQALATNYTRVEACYTSQDLRNIITITQQLRNITNADLYATVANTYIVNKILSRLF